MHSNQFGFRKMTIRYQTTLKKRFIQSPTTKLLRKLVALEKMENFLNLLNRISSVDSRPETK